MSSIRHLATSALEHNQITIEHVLVQLMNSPQKTMVLIDEHGDSWTFTARRRCRLFLMAKTPFMKQYEEIHVVSK